MTFPLVAIASLFAVCALFCQTSVAASLPAANQQALQAAFDPLHVAYPTFSDGDRAFEIVRGKSWPLEVALSERGQQVRTFVLPQVMEQVAQIRVFRDRLIVHGWMNSSAASDVAVFDLRSGVMQDEVWCYGPVFAPDSSRIAFRKFYPSHGIDTWEDQDLVYELSGSAQQNRPALGPGRPQAGKPTVAVGFPIFPLADGELGRRNVNLDDPKPWHKQSAFFWSADSRRVAFLASRDGKTSLVVADTSGLAAQLNSAQFNSALMNTTAAALPELADLCNARDTESSDCTDFAYDLTRLALDAHGIDIHLSTPGPTPVSRRLHVDESRLQAVAR